LLEGEEPIMSQRIDTGGGNEQAGAAASIDAAAAASIDAAAAAATPISERPAGTANGFLGILVMLALVGLGALVFFVTPAPLQALGVIPVLLALPIGASLVVVAPGEAAVIEFFGRYVGTVRTPGLAWTVPLAIRRRVSVRVRNFETGRIKVNDAAGNPVEIVAIVVWRVADTAKAVYAVDSFTDFVAVQAESALRRIASTYPYDGAEGERSLRGSTSQVSEELAVEVAERATAAGVDIVEVRISHLAYAPEIAQAMLRRQQADAIVAARERVVEGAVGMVELALRQLSEHEIVDLDDERKAAMVSNLMVVLCSDQPTSPIVNAGTLYSA